MTVVYALKVTTYARISLDSISHPYIKAAVYDTRCVQRSYGRHRVRNLGMRSGYHDFSNPFPTYARQDSKLVSATNAQPSLFITLRSLLSSDQVNNGRCQVTPATYAHATSGCPLLGNGSVKTPKRMRGNIRQFFFSWGPPRGYITRNSKAAVSYQELGRVLEMRVEGD